MTAMCDVAFLCLPFVMTSTAKIPEACGYSSSTVQTKLPESDLATLSVGKGMVFLT
jgi:hypothetical protein